MKLNNDVEPFKRGRQTIESFLTIRDSDLVGLVQSAQLARASLDELAVTGKAKRELYPRLRLGASGREHDLLLGGFAPCAKHESDRL